MGTGFSRPLALKMSPVPHFTALLFFSTHFSLPLLHLETFGWAVWLFIQSSREGWRLRRGGEAGAGAEKEPLYFQGPGLR